MIEFDTETTAVPGASRTFTIGSKPAYQSEKGWECPRCGRINAPWVRACDCSNKWEVTCNGDEWWKSYITNTTADCVGGSDYWDANTSTWSNCIKNCINKKEK